MPFTAHLYQILSNPLPAYRISRIPRFAPPGSLRSLHYNRTPVPHTTMAATEKSKQAPSRNHPSRPHLVFCPGCTSPFLPLAIAIDKPWTFPVTPNATLVSVRRPPLFPLQHTCGHPRYREVTPLLNTKGGNAYSCGRKPTTGTISRNADEACRCVHVDQTLLPVPYATNSAGGRNHKKHDIS